MRPECAEVRPRLSPHLDGDLPAEAGAAVRKHLESCAECRAELELLRLTVSALRRLPELPAPAGILAGVRARLAPRPWHRRLAQRIGRGWRVGVPIGALASLLVIVGVVFFQARYPALRRAVTTPETQVASAPAPPPAGPPGAPAPADSPAPAEGPAPLRAPKAAAPVRPTPRKEGSSAVRRESPAPAPVLEATPPPAPAAPPTAPASAPPRPDAAAPQAALPAAPPAAPSLAPPAASEPAPAAALSQPAALPPRAEPFRSSAEAEVAAEAPRRESALDSREAAAPPRELGRRPLAEAAGESLGLGRRGYEAGEARALAPAPRSDFSKARSLAAGAPAFGGGPRQPAEEVEFLTLLSEDGDDIAYLRTLLRTEGGRLIKARTMNADLSREAIRPLRQQIPRARELRQAWEIGATVPRRNLGRFLEAVQGRPGYRVLERRPAGAPPGGAAEHQSIRINLFR